MERYEEIINICNQIDRKDLGEFLEGLLHKIKSDLEDMDDEDYVSDDDSESEAEDDPLDPLDETEFKVQIDEDGFWSFVFSDEE
tara:strand:+ start:22 stop:273 length:252 start_codon:yes stop_codon:yes gene_type:complete